MRKLRLGNIHTDILTFAQALDAIEELVQRGEGGYVLTPNVDHVCLAEDSPELCEAYAGASLSLVDGMPLVWLSRVLGEPLPEKISGSDLVGPLMARAAARGMRVYLLGAAPGVALRAADALRAAHPGLEIVGVASPPVGFDADAAASTAVVAEIAAARAQIVLVALGCPKQELWLHRQRASLAPAIGVGVGATLDFLAGDIPRAPRWMSQAGLEWLYRLSREPRRLYQRYLVRDRAIVGIVARMLLSRRDHGAHDG